MYDQRLVFSLCVSLFFSFAVCVCVCLSQMLTFYTEMHDVPLFSFNTAAADKKMETVVEAIKIILQNAAAPS